MKAFKSMLMDSLDIPASKKLLLPSGFQKVGDIVILQLNGELSEYEKDVGRVVKEHLKVKSVFRKGIVSGGLRKPEIKRIAGNINTTIHKENGCFYKMDVTKVMFAKGNSFERSRVIAGEGEEVIDMFAGIGYFCINIAKKTPSCNVYAVEKSPDSVSLLRENVKLNRLHNVEIMEGDCRDVEEIRGDRVIMGYLPGTQKFLPKAFELLRSSGVIHYHDLFRKNELWRRPLGVLEEEALKNGYKMDKVLYKKVVKQYSPCKYHVVVDALFRRK
jgi:tRNA wybutosine-synthesizing protein 2